MEKVSISDLDQLLLGRRVDSPCDSVMQKREKLSGRGYLLVCDDESIRDSAIHYLKEIVELKYLDFNAEPQGKKISEMCIAAYGTSYHQQKEYGFDVSTLSERSINGHDIRGVTLVLDNFQDIGLLAIRDAKLSLAFLRSLGRPPYEKTVIAVGSKESLDLIKHDHQLECTWATYELVRN